MRASRDDEKPSVSGSLAGVTSYARAEAARPRVAKERIDKDARQRCRRFIRMPFSIRRASVIGRSARPYGGSIGSNLWLTAHDPEKCAAVFRKDHAQNKNLGLVFRLQRAAGEIAIEETGLVGRRLLLRLLENLLMPRRQRAGRIGRSGIAGQRKGLATAAAEIDLAEFARFARLLHPPRSAIAVEGIRVLPDPGNRMVRAHRFEFESGDALG